MNYTYFGNRIERSPLGNMGLQLLETQEKLVSRNMKLRILELKQLCIKHISFVIPY